MNDTNKPLIIERVFDAPVEKVWNAWSDENIVKQWWGPDGFTAPFVKIDFRVGGKYLFCMRGSAEPGKPEQDFWSTGTYREIEPMKKIVCTDSFADEHGNIVSSTHYGMDEFALELLVTITFKEIEGGKTKMTLNHVGIPSGPNMDGARDGWGTSFDKLAEALTKN